MTASLVCADNTGAKILRIAQVKRFKGRHSRLPSVCCGGFCNRDRQERSSGVKKTDFRRSNNKTEISC